MKQNLSMGYFVVVNSPLCLKKTKYCLETSQVLSCEIKIRILAETIASSHKLCNLVVLGTHAVTKSNISAFWQSYTFFFFSVFSHVHGIIGLNGVLAKHVSASCDSYSVEEIGTWKKERIGQKFHLTRK